MEVDVSLLEEKVDSSRLGDFHMSLGFFPKDLPLPSFGERSTGKVYRALGWVTVVVPLPLALVARLGHTFKLSLVTRMSGNV